MKIYVLTPIYPTYKDGGYFKDTCVVHYFAKEWVKMGHEVCVFHLQSKFPSIYYLIARQIPKMLSMTPAQVSKKYDEVMDGVMVKHIPINKIIPHTKIAKRECERVLNEVKNYCDQNGNPDWFIGHWDIPQLELLPEIKRRIGVPIALILHNNEFDLEKAHGKGVKQVLNVFDALGFRNTTSKQNYLKKYNPPKKCFMAYSGVSKVFVESGNYERCFSDREINNFIYVGALISRKYPGVILSALNITYPDGGFHLTYVGEGAERGAIERTKTKGEVKFTGFVSREKVIPYLKSSDVFIMVSKGEIFGLVYLEAMAMGCITVASRNEGMDSIIIDGYNGFLCQAGCEEELIQIIKKINAMPADELQLMSERAKETARAYSDYNVADKYLKGMIE